MSAARTFSDRAYRGGDIVVAATEMNSLVASFIATIERVHGPVPRVTLTDEKKERGSAAIERVARIITKDDDTHRQRRFYLREFPRNESLPLYRGEREIGQAFFRGHEPVFIPVLDTRWTTWMSLTPNEIITLRPGLRNCRGHVLVGGLGLGWFARRVLENPRVTRVTVVESNQDTLDFFGEPLRRDFGDRVELVAGDAFKVGHKRLAEFDAIRFDIWEGCGHSRDCPKWRALASEHANTWAW